MMARWKNLYTAVLLALTFLALYLGVLSRDYDGNGFVAAALWLLVRARPNYLLVGAMVGFAVLSWQANVFLIPLFLALLLLRQERMRAFVSFLSCSMGVPLAAYIGLAVMEHGLDSPR